MQKDSSPLQRLIKLLYQTGEIYTEPMVVFLTILEAHASGAKVPDGIADLLLDAMTRYASSEAQTLDEAFGVQRKPNSRRRSKHKVDPMTGDTKRFQVYYDVIYEREKRGLLKPPQHTTHRQKTVQDVFRAAGDKYGLSPKAVEQWCGEVKKLPPP